MFVSPQEMTYADNLPIVFVLIWSAPGGGMTVDVLLNWHNHILPFTRV